MTIQSRVNPAVQLVATLAVLGSLFWYYALGGTSLRHKGILSAGGLLNSSSRLPDDFALGELLRWLTSGDSNGATVDAAEAVWEGEEEVADDDMNVTFSDVDNPSLLNASAALNTTSWDDDDYGDPTSSSISLPVKAVRPKTSRAPRSSPRPTKFRLRLDGSGSSSSGSSSKLEPSPQPRAASGRFSHFVADLEHNPVYTAYGAMLVRLMELPPAKRRYVVAQPLSGWGNKIRVVATGLQLALALDRILVLDDQLMRPFFGPLFAVPHAPWFASQIDGALTAGAARIVLKSPHKRNDVMNCWAAKHSLAHCIKRLPDARALVFQGYFNGDGYIRQDEELALGLRDALAPYFQPSEQQRLFVLPHRHVVDTWASQALLPRTKRGLRASVDDAKADMQWGKYSLHVGVHLRVFVDYAKRRVSVRNINPGFWSCVMRQVAALQASQGVGPNETLIFVASDLPAARPHSREALQSVGTVKWNGHVRGFKHTESKRDAAALETVMTDWLLLSETDLIVGTDLSTFGPAAAIHGGAPLVLSSMKKTGRGARMCTEVPEPHYGTVN